MLKNFKYLKGLREEGFTLIELLVVIMIIGILAALALPIFSRQTVLARQAELKVEVRNTAAAIQTQLTLHPKAKIKESTTGKDYFENGVAYIAIFNKGDDGEVSIRNENGDISSSADSFATWDNYRVKAEMEAVDPFLDIEWEYAYDSRTGQFIEKDEEDG